MGVFDKIKNLFTEEEEIEVPIKKEVKHVEIAPPRREIKEEPVRETVIKEEKVEPIKREIKEEPVREIIDNKALNREERFKFPVYFTDEDFEDLPKKEEVKKVEIKKEEPKVQPYKPIVEEKKSFKPSPIISPVYGVLDKNYKKDDIKASKERPKRHIVDEKLTVDDIRNKAYGTLEDDLEKALVMDEPKYVEEKEPSIDIFEELENSRRNRKEETVDLAEALDRQKQKIEEINAYIKQNTVIKEEPKEEKETINEVEETVDLTEELKQELNEEVKQEVEETVEFELPEEKIQEFELKKEDLEETKSLEPIVVNEKEEPEEMENGDLFSLIDSMYEKREEE